MEQCDAVDPHNGMDRCTLEDGHESPHEVRDDRGLSVWTAVE